ncbi:P-loop containing nucleoside triphosphate hydrolase protein [Exidia glandulosa HHB12029]|uniref:p-loop containing nucleoside triphosphate hydrolase protein n=1 Tax=Exidia glandulosa HHB12029 TaxID=1314781 RepID=A0A165QH26_EXIGL|nr:P-loop containing nucleoside triphosphate hydrolase protein [Exidia glandulosa HHB12029]
MATLNCAFNDVACGLALGLDLVGPALAVLVALIYAIALKTRFGRLYDDKIEDEFEVEEVAVVDVHEDTTEASPLLGRRVGTVAHGRTLTANALIVIGTLEFATRMALYVRAGLASASWINAPELVKLTVWLYAAVNPLVNPPRTAPYGLFGIYSFSFLGSLLGFYTYFTSDAEAPVASLGGSFIVAHSTLSLLALVLVLRMPMQVSLPPPVLDADVSGLKPALEDYATLGQWLSYSWLTPLIEQGKIGPLEENDVWQLARRFRSQFLLRKFATIAPESSFMVRLFNANLRDILSMSVLTWIAVTLGVAQPMILSQILRSMEAAATANVSFLESLQFSTLPDFMVMRVGTTTVAKATQTAVLWIAIAFLAQIVRGVADTQNLYVARRVILSAKSQATARLYEKTLRRIDTSGLVGHQESKGKDAEGKEDSKEEDASADVGKITNLVTNDTNRINSFVNFWLMLCRTPLSVFLTCTFLYRIMGWSAFAGYITLLVATPFNNFLMRQEFSALQGSLKMRDIRMTSMNELVQAIKFIKLSAWEMQWSERVLRQRELELQQVRKHKWAMFGINTLWDLAPIFVSCISLTTFTLVAHRELSVSIAFPALLTFQMLSEELTNVPIFANLAQRVYASLTRIGDYLEEEEVPLQGQESSSSFDNRVGCEKATFVWNTTAITKATLLAKELKKKTEQERKQKSWLRKFTSKKATMSGSSSVPATPSTPQQPFTLRDISVTFPRGKMSLICGATGSGKSSLLAALLGEMKHLEGKAFLPKFPDRVDPDTGLKESVSYCAQHPWLQHQSIRDNILFGTPYHEKRYNDVLAACALLPDLKVLADGDKTEIGEKGITLSGGQKARVALARAVYAFTKTVMLDDVLSAVDTHTASALIQGCFLGPLMEGRTVILVTHHVDSVIKHCSYVVRLEHGAIQACGTVDELRASGHLSALYAQASSNAVNEHEASDQLPEANPVDRDADEDKVAKTLMETEVKAVGAVAKKIHVMYISAAGYWIVGMLLFALILQRCSDLGQRLWVKTWSESYEDNARSDPTPPPFDFPSANENPLPYIAVYTGIQFIAAIGWLLIQLPDVIGSLRASRIIFKQMLEGIVRSPIRWFDVTPAGRILNRFSKDIDGIDEGLSHYYGSVAFNLVTLIVSLSIIAYGVPPFLLVAVVLGYLHVYVAEGYIKAARDLNRLENTFRSPLISAFGELLLGVSTVRAFGEQQRFMRDLFKHLDRTQAASYYNIMTDYWLRLRFSVLSALTFVATAILAISLNVHAGLAAIVIMQAQGLYNTMYYGMFSIADTEQAFNSLERVADYAELPSEPPRITDKRPPPTWPSAGGGIEFDAVVVKYAADLDTVLKSVTFKIKPKEKIGLVGRTGSGKSTMALSLFRFVDPAEGKIVVDGIDITSIGVQDLRSRLTIIPQDAVLFKGTIRDNLDPFGEHTDAECLAVLRSVQLLEDEHEQSIVSADASGVSTLRPDVGSKILVTLESQVSDGGNNWSAGQRQLIAMARALLRKTRITVLDESTASVDFETDTKIQTAIREGFKESIVLIIAHRLHTIIECDRILVLDAGQIVEFDTPANLLEHKDGVFRAMCEKSDGFEALFEAVKRKAAGG